MQGFRCSARSRSRSPRPRAATSWPGWPTPTCRCRSATTGASTPPTSPPTTRCVPVRWVDGRDVVEVYAIGTDHGEAMFAEAGDVATAQTLLTFDDGTPGVVSNT